MSDTRKGYYRIRKRQTERERENIIKREQRKLVGWDHLFDKKERKKQRISTKYKIGPLLDQSDGANSL